MIIMKLSVVVPCYNEEDNIEKLKAEFFPVIEKLVESRLPDGERIESVEIVFVDDGSKDHTFDALKNVFGSYQQAGISVVFEKHAVNRGLGAALRTGFKASTGNIIV